MNRRPFSVRSLAVAATADSATATSISTSAAAMTHRPYLRGGRPIIRRRYSDSPLDPGGNRQEFVSGDSHFAAVQNANRGFRPSYHAVPPPPQYAMVQRPGPPVVQQHHGPRPYQHPRQVGPVFGNNQQLRPHQMPRQFRPRPSKSPDYREWEYKKPGLPPHSERFSVLSYNILADSLASEHWHKLYFHIPRHMMDWNWRKRSIIFELGLWSADILCFQEVDRFLDIEAELRPRGYHGIWKMRTGDHADGCAIFWRVSRFKLLHEESIEFTKLGLRDNVAQICVFESLFGQNNNNGASTLSTSSASSYRVVVCNIHVLFNTKRGDIKLGQIRVLLDRAHAVSKLWDDAPIVICGDFNCTPKSPLYNFITGEKLDLSELARDKVSGQASSEIRPPRPAYPYFRTLAADNSTQSSAVDCVKIEQGDLPSDAQKSACADVPTNAPSTGSSPSVRHDTESPILTDTNSVLEPPSEETHSETTEGRENFDSKLHPLAETPDNQVKYLCLPDNHSDDPSKPSEPMGTNNSDASECEGPSEKSFPNSPDAASSEHEAVALSVLAANDNIEPSDVSASCEATSVDVTLDEKFEALSLGEVVDDKITEDCESFLSELHGAGQSLVPTDTEILNHNFEHKSLLESGNWSYNPSVWTPAEIQAATGMADCNVMENPLKLTSAYAEVENSSGLRDSNGEPFVTSYHRRFLGTVDYIWHSEGLQTVKVLAPIPKHVMKQTQGFPTRKWGSDHIALVSEFAFTKDISSQNSNQ